MPQKINARLATAIHREFLGIQQHGEAEARKLARGRNLAGGYGGATKFSAGDQAPQVIRKMVQVGSFEPRDSNRLRAERRPILIAIPARIVHVRHDGKSIGLEKARDLLFLFLARSWRNDGGKILRSVIFFAAALDGDADGVYLWIEDVGAVRRRIHPRDVQRRNVGGLGDVFGDQAEAGASHVQTCLQVGFTVEAVRERIVRS